jgi:tRNA 2-thiouridine synthesizing protein E
MNISKQQAAEIKYSSKAPVDTDVNSQRRTQRELELGNWSEEQAHKIAAAEDVELSPDHLRVIHRLREYYLEHGTVKSGRELGDMLNKEFASQGGRKYLHTLFPNGPVTQGMQFAGLPVPAYSEDKGFGTSR